MSDEKSSFEVQRLTASDILVLKTTFDHMLAQIEKNHPGDDRHGRYLMAEYLSDALLHYMFNDCPERSNELTNNRKANCNNGKKTEKPETSHPFCNSPGLATTKEKESSTEVSPIIISVRTTRQSRNCQAANHDEGLLNDVPISRSPLRQRKRKVCEEVGCHRCPVKGHLCPKHGGTHKKRCSVPECPNEATRGGVCARHGGKAKRCSEPGCLNQSYLGGVCARHGATKKICEHPGCNHKARQGGVCSTHGATRPKCRHPDCDTNAVKNGVCCRHGAKKKPCRTPGCQNQTKSGGVCYRHGAK